MREGARRMLAAALEAEVDATSGALADERDERGRRLVVRNGHAEPRTIATGAGPIEVEAPAGERQAGRRRDGRAGPVPQLDPAAVVPQEPEGGRGAAVDVPARDELAATSRRRWRSSSARRPGCRRR